MHMQPTGQHLEQLQSALLDAFDHAALTRLVRYGLELDLEWITPVQGKRDLTTVVDELIAHCASQQGGLKCLLKAACEQNPTNDQLANLSIEWSAIEFEPILRPQQNDIGDTHVAISIANDGGKVENASIQIGDVTGRDKIIQGNEIHGDKITGNKIVYEQIMPRAVDETILAIAKAKLAQLPLDTIPPLAVLPPGSRILYSVNPLFVGREEELLTLAAHLKGGETIAIGQIAAATGLGGIGKTQLAAAFVHHFGQFFAGGVHWLSFADPKSVSAEIAACGLMMSDLRADYATLDLETQVHLVLAAWQSPLPRLLVFDNCEDPNLLVQWKPPTGGSRVLLTSRRASWDAALSVYVVTLSTLERWQSLEMLGKFPAALHKTPFTVDEEPALNAIATELGDLPLALHLAGSYLARYRQVVSPASYLAKLRQPDLLEHRSLQAGDLSPTGHVQHVARTFALGYEQLRPDNPQDALAQALLVRAACFAPGQPIPRSLLLADDEEGAVQAADALEQLANLGLLEMTAAGDLLVHRLVVYFVKHADPTSASVAQQAVVISLLQEANRINEAETPKPLVAWQCHLRYVTDAIQNHADEQAAKLCNELGIYLHLMGSYAAAKPYLERSLAIREAVLGKGHIDIGESCNELGILLHYMGDLAAAKPYLERSLEIREAVLGKEHPVTAGSYNNLGLLYLSMGNYATAKPYLERTLAIYEAVLGTQHYDTARSYNNLGGLFEELGDYAAAKPYYERALAIREAVLGKEHPATAQSYSNLGNLLNKLDELDEAKPYLERALAIRKAVLGTAHPDTAFSYSHLGKLLNKLNELDEAKPYLEQALAIRKAVLGTEHPDTAFSYSYLGSLLQATGDFTAAQFHIEHCLEIREAILGQEHPHTGQSYNDLGMLLQHMGNYAAAKPYFKRALAIFENSLGSNHPSTQTVRNNLAALDK